MFCVTKNFKTQTSSLNFWVTYLLNTGKKDTATRIQTACFSEWVTPQTVRLNSTSLHRWDVTSTKLQELNCFSHQQKRSCIFPECCSVKNNDVLSHIMCNHISFFSLPP